MIGGLLTAVALIAVPAGFLSGGVAFNAWRSGEGALAAKSGAIFAACVLVFLLAPKPGQKQTAGDCYTDWDARSNSTVCN